MATDATGSPTSLGIPTYNTAADAPSGLGFNAAMAAIDALLVNRKHAPTRQIFTSGSGTYTTPANVIAILVELIGGGGGSSGCAASGSTVQASAGLGGGGGAYASKLIGSPLATYAYVVGAGGSAGASGANAGGVGADTTFGATIVVAKGGGAGNVGEILAGGTNVTFGVAGPGGASGSSVGDWVLAGHGPLTWRFAATVVSTNGGAAAHGAMVQENAIRSGGVGTGGQPGIYPGGGAAGAMDSNNTPRAGAIGAAGIVIVTEFYG